MQKRIVELENLVEILDIGEFLLQYPYSSSEYQNRSFKTHAEKWPPTKGDVVNDGRVAVLACVCQGSLLCGGLAASYPKAYEHVFEIIYSTLFTGTNFRQTLFFQISRHLPRLRRQPRP